MQIADNLHAVSNFICREKQDKYCLFPTVEFPQRLVLLKFILTQVKINRHQATLQPLALSGQHQQIGDTFFPIK